MTDDESSLVVLGRAVDNIGDANERKVLSLVHHLAPALKDWRAAGDLRAQIATTEAQINSQQELMGQLRPQLIEAQTASEAASVKKNKFTRISGVSLAVVFLLSWLVLGFFLALILSAVIGGVVYWFFAKVKKDFEDRQGEVTALEKRIADASSAQERGTAELAALVSELGTRAKGFPEIRLAELQFPLAAARIGTRNLLVDLSGAHETVSLHAIDVSALESGVKYIADRADELLQVPLMLAPSSTASDDLDNDVDETLHGEEEDLQNLVTDFTRSLGQLKDTKLELPLVDSDSILARRLADRAAGPTEAASGIVISEAEGGIGQIQAFVDAANQTREQASAVFADLRNVFNRLEEACDLYSVARTNSLNAVHENLFEVLNRANWCNRRFYCPRSILSPAYIQELVGVDLDHAHEIPLYELVQRLRTDPVIERRIDSQPALLQDLEEAYEELADFIHNAGIEDGDPDSTTGLPVHLANQLRDYRQKLRNSLQKLMTGSTYPILNFSAEAQLFFDPATGAWSSPTSPYTYSTSDVMRFGSMVKAYTDVMMPLWDHLWTEKSDFRKSEIFRTNESMIRMSEKESEKLIEIGNQFRADMRTVREHVYTLESDIKSVGDELIGFRDGMSQLGLLSDKALASLSDDRLKELARIDVDSSAMDRMETMLMAIPQGQAELRGSVHDPIEAIKEPSALLLGKSLTGSRLVASQE
jgi:hypothetical protein